MSNDLNGHGEEFNFGTLKRKQRSQFSFLFKNT